MVGFFFKSINNRLSVVSFALIWFANDQREFTVVNGCMILKKETSMTLLAEQMDTFFLAENREKFVNVYLFL